MGHRQGRCTVSGYGLAYSLRGYAGMRKRGNANYCSGPSATPEQSVLRCAWDKLLTRHCLSEKDARALLMDSTERGRNLRQWVRKNHMSRYVPEEILCALGIDDEQVLRGRASKECAPWMGE